MQQNRLVFLAMGCLFTTAALGLILRPLFPIDETRYLDVAWEMSQSGNWLVPTKNFAIYSDKPPLLFWTINLVWLVTGVSEYAARLVGPAFACLAIWLTAILARRLWPDDERAGGLAAMSLAGLMIFALSGSLTMFDVPLAVATLAGLIALERAGRPSAGTGRDLWPWAGFGAALALGVLTKGPVILFHLLPVAIALPLWSASPIGWRRLASRIGFGLLVGLGLVAIWLLPAAILGGPEYREAILWRQSAGRLTESFAHAKPWWFYLALLPVLTFPLMWSPALWSAGLRTRWLADRGLRLCLIWFGAALILFSLTSGKQVHYLVPELPALALIATRLGRDAGRIGQLPAVIVLAALAALATVAGTGLLPMGSLENALAPNWPLIAGGALIAAVCWLATRRNGPAAAMILSLGTLLSMNLMIGLTRTADIYSTDPIGARLAGHETDGVAFFGSRYHAEFNFAARLSAPVDVLSDLATLTDWVSAHPQGLIVARMDSADIPWPEKEKLLFRNRDWGIWSASDAPAAIR